MKKKDFFKIIRRLKFLLAQTKGKDWRAILSSLYPASRREEMLAKVLNIRGLIKWDKDARIFQFNGYRFFYQDLSLIHI